MKRREFVRNISLTSLVISAGAVHGLSAKTINDSSFILLDDGDHFTLPSPVFLEKV